MSAMVMGAVLQRGPMRGPLRHALVAIADNADDYGFAFVSMDTIAVKSCCDRRTAMRRVQALELERWIGVVRDCGAIDGKCNVYFIDVRRLGIEPNPKMRRSDMHAKVLAWMETNAKSGDTLSPVKRAASRDNGVPVQVTKPADSGDKTGVAISKNRCEPLSNQRTPLPPAVRGDAALDASRGVSGGNDRTGSEKHEHPLRVVAGEAVRMAPGAVMGGEFLLANLHVGKEADPNRVATRVCRDEGGGGAPWAAAGTEVGTEVGRESGMNTERKWGQEVGTEVRTPAVRVGRDSEMARWYAQLVCAAAEVMNGCGWPENPRLANTIADALGAHCRKAKCTPEEAKTLAIKQVEVYGEVSSRLRFTWGWPKFFRGMYWVNSGLWPYDEEIRKRMNRPHRF